MKKPHFEFYVKHYATEWGPTQWRWRLRAPNGRIVASGEGFSSKAKAVASFRAVAKYAPGAVER